MGQGSGMREVGYFDCAGGGQVVVVDNIAYIGHLQSPHGTSLVDVGDPRHCRELASIGMPPGTHSHKVRVANGLMVVNHELMAPAPAAPASSRAGPPAARAYTGSISTGATSTCRRRSRATSAPSS